ncbi:MAG: hypothetical protein OIF38_12070, partial [Cellvibrionaceae bacterium]|nr:hypothetical protein [Cellvibrionaceae bacterium]
HSLEFSRCPHDLLREAQRVLIAHGHLIVTVFNPYSLLGIYGLFGRFWHRNHIWRRRLLSASANKDWLQLLGLQPLEQHAHLYRPPLSQQGLLSSTRWVETLGQKMGGLNWGASYTILARKDVAAMTPIKPKWQEVSGGDKLVVGAVSRGAPRLVLVENKPLKTETKPVK